MNALDQVTLADVNYDIHSERYTFTRGAGDCEITHLILEEYTYSRDRFSGPLEAIRAFIHAHGDKELSIHDLDNALVECYASYITDDLLDQARHDQDVCGIQEILADMDAAELAENWPEFVDATGTVDLSAVDIADRVEQFELSLAVLPDPITGKLYYFYMD